MTGAAARLDTHDARAFAIPDALTMSNRPATPSPAPAARYRDGWGRFRDGATGVIRLATAVNANATGSGATASRAGAGAGEHVTPKPGSSPAHSPNHRNPAYGSDARSAEWRRATIAAHHLDSIAGDCRSARASRSGDDSAEAASKGLSPNMGC